MQPNKPLVIAIMGPTASGKTELAIDIAKKINSNIHNVDSRQIYIDMDIGTAKPTLEQKNQCPHHFIDIINPDQSYSGLEFARRARCLIENISSKGGIPLLVGGTGLYWQSIVDDFLKMKQIMSKLEKLCRYSWNAMV